MKTLEKLKKEMDDAWDVHDAAADDDVYDAADRVWRTARTAYYKRLKEIENEDT